MSTLHRKREGEMTYRKYLKTHVHAKDICVFCEIVKGNSSEQVIKTYRHFFVAVNTFPYTLWDSCTVTEHLMVVPKRHIKSTSSFTKDEVQEHHKITASYEKDGYDLYSRGASSTMKSIAHQHTHIIKTNGKKIKALLYIEKPLVHKTIH